MEWLQALDRSGVDAAAALYSALALGSPTAYLLDGVARLVEGDLLKMGPLMLPLLYTWLRPRGREVERDTFIDPERVLRGMLGILLALLIGRLLQDLLPMRLRPRLALPDIPFPRGFEVSHDWSSFPSDHAVLVGALVTVIWVNSRPLGLLSATWGVVGVCLPRIYFGVHYASDILAGLALGVALTALVLMVPLPAVAWNWLRWLATHKPALLILGLFVFGWEVIETFYTVRQLITGVGEAAYVIAPLISGGEG